MADTAEEPMPAVLTASGEEEEEHVSALATADNSSPVASGQRHVTVVTPRTLAASQGEDPPLGHRAADTKTKKKKVPLVPSCAKPRYASPPSSVGLPTDGGPSDRSSSVGTLGTVGNASSARSGSPVDPLNQYKKSLELLEKKQRLVEKALAARAKSEEGFFKPTISANAAGRASRDVINVNAEWSKQREARINKKVKQKLKDEEKEVAQVKFIDPKSDKICRASGYTPVHTQGPKAILEARADAMETLQKRYAYPFAPAIHSFSSNSNNSKGRDGGSPTSAAKRSRSASVRLFAEFKVRSEKLSEKQKAKEDAFFGEIERKRSQSVGKPRTAEETSKHVEKLLAWHQLVEDRRKLKLSEAEAEAEATFQPYVSPYSAQLALCHRPHFKPPEQPGHRSMRSRSPTTTRGRADSFVPAGTVKCAPLPDDFYSRNQRHLQRKSQREQQHRAAMDQATTEACTFQPRISAVSQAIMEEVSRPPGAATNDLSSSVMRPTASAERREAERTASPSPPPRRGLGAARGEAQGRPRWNHHEIPPHKKKTNPQRSPSPPRSVQARSPGTALVQYPSSRGGAPTSTTPASKSSRSNASPSPMEPRSAAGAVSSSSIRRESSSNVDAKMAELKDTLAQWKELSEV